MIRPAGVAVLAMLAMLAHVAPVRAQAPAGPGFDSTVFDQPLATRVVAIPAHDGDAAQTVRCSSYQDFVVKDVAFVEDMGASRIAILPAPSGRAPPCRLAPLRGERALALEQLSQFPGVVFVGAKAGFVFLASADAVENAVGFAVLRSANGKLLFHDWSHSALQFQPAAAGGVAARYTRSFTGDCSVLAGGETCARSIAQASAATAPAPALCKAGYAATYTAYGDDRCRGNADPKCRQIARAEVDNSPSVVYFPAEFSVTAAGAASHALGPPDACWPAE